MNLFIQHKTSEEQPKESNWYQTDRGLLYYFTDKENWSCRDDRLSVEYPWLWYEKVEQEKQIYSLSIVSHDLINSIKEESNYDYNQHGKSWQWAINEMSDEVNEVWCENMNKIYELAYKLEEQLKSNNL